MTCNNHIYIQIFAPKSIRIILNLSSFVLGLGKFDSNIFFFICQGSFYPALQLLISCWAPRHERSRLFTFAYSGAPIGNIIGFLSAGFLCSGGFAGGWPSVFYVYGEKMNLCSGVLGLNMINFVSLMIQ